MKKDMDWLKREIHKELETWHGVEGGIDGDGINKIMSLINQLDEPETVEQTALLLENVLKENKRLGELLEEKHEEWLELMDEINNQENETLSDEWVDSNSVYVSSDGIIEEYVHVDDLKELLAPKQELPVIPKLVADFIEFRKGRNVYSLKHILSVAVERSKQEEYTEAYDWISANDELFARAWLDGYEVEEGPLYRARLKVINDEFISSYLRTQSSNAKDRLKAMEIGSKYIHENYRHLSEFTEDELKRLDIWGSKQWELEEVE